MPTIQIDHAADIFRSHQGDFVAMENVTLGEMQDFIPAHTFEKFIDINQIKVYEEFPK